MDARWAPGTWIGKRWRTTEHYVNTPTGVIKCRAIKRKPIEDRWSREAIERIEATPWRLTPSPKDGSGGPRVLPPLPDDQLIRDGPKPREPEVRAPLRPRIQKSDLNRWGYTEGCLRCRQMRSGKGAEDGSTHSEKCRQRIETEMRRENDPRVKKAEDKHTEYQEEVMRAKAALDTKTRTAGATRRGGAEGDAEAEKC